jgi:hypothetical protein
MAMSWLIVSQVARHFGVKPRDISDAFYQRLLDDTRCPIVGGRRLIPTDYLPAIETHLREHGLLPEGSPCN